MTYSGRPNGSGAGRRTVENEEASRPKTYFKGEDVPDTPAELNAANPVVNPTPVNSNSFEEFYIQNPEAVSALASLAQSYYNRNPTGTPATHQSQHQPVLHAKLACPLQQDVTPPKTHDVFKEVPFANENVPSTSGLSSSDSRMAKFCTGCGLKFNREKDKFCGECGLKRESIT